MATLLIDYGTLLVHYVIVFKQAFANTKVVFLNLLLRTFNGTRNHRRFYTFAFLKPKTIHYLCNTL